MPVPPPVSKIYSAPLEYVRAVHLKKSCFNTGTHTPFFSQQLNKQRRKCTGTIFQILRTTH